MGKHSKIFVAGHNGMVGSAVLSLLQSSGYNNIVTRSRSQIDLTNQAKVDKFFENNSIDVVILCAAKVGGISANNTYRADFLYDNLQIATNVIKSAHNSSVKKLINLGSSCIYPKNPKLPITEEQLLAGALEKTNEPYAIAKIAALKMCEAYYHQYGDNFYSIMPCNLYGENDNFDLYSSHVLPALINKFHTAKKDGSEFVKIWGSGKPRREFLHVRDLASAILLCLEKINAEDIYKYNISHLNCGSSQEFSILELANIIKSIVGFRGEIRYDKTKPDGTFRKLMNSNRMFKLGFTPSIALTEGIRQTYNWYLKNNEEK
jgi:GDP-L-fucose synthase